MESINVSISRGEIYFTHSLPQSSSTWDADGNLRHGSVCTLFLECNIRGTWDEKHFCNDSQKNVLPLGPTWMPKAHKAIHVMGPFFHCFRQIFAVIDDLGLRNHTFVYFASDHTGYVAMPSMVDGVRYTKVRRVMAGVSLWLGSDLLIVIQIHGMKHEMNEAWKVNKTILLDTW